MIRYLTVVCLLAILFGCQQPPKPVEPRKRITLDELAIDAHGQPRKFMMSDKRGGFLWGNVTNGIGIHWAVDGRDVMTDYDVTVNDVSLKSPGLQSSKILPHHVQNAYPGGVTETLAAIELPERAGRHAILIRVRSEQPAEIVFKAKPAADFTAQKTGNNGNELILKQRGSDARISIFAGTQGKVAAGAILVPGAREAAFLLMFDPQEDPRAEETYAALETYENARAARMENLLNTSYLRTSDPDLDKAMHWVKLSLDALVIETRDTFAVAGLPWDGSLDVRENARSIAGLHLATGEYNDIAGIIRTLGRWQDTVASHTTFGRLADKVTDGNPTYNGADVAPWFVREMFGFVTWTNDTALVRTMYPLVKRSIEGTLKYHTDSLNFLVHGDNETWMNSPGSPRGNRAAEVQLLWYFQQLIGSYIATHVLDLDPAQRWSQLATRTVKNFSSTFIDTARHLVDDHLTKDGTGVSDARPNAMYCLEMMGNELVEQSVVRETFNSLAYPYGVGTLASSDKRFQSSMHNGAVWTWLTGQMTYALTRLDRQDLSYQLTQGLVQQVLSGDMAGTMPSMLVAGRRAGQDQPVGAGLDASLSGMAELVRSVYQDYIGISFDVPSNFISLNPKLPDSLKNVDCTVLFGTHPINIRYTRDGHTARATLEAPSTEGDIKVRFMWMMENGNAWKGTTTLHAPKPLTLVFTEDEALAFDGDKEMDLQYRQKLVGFSQRKDFQGLEFAKVPSRRLN